jgi:purine-nucleoside phosphorylase
MQDFKKNLSETISYLKGKINKEIDIAITLGTGLTAIENLLEDKVIIPYEGIPNFPISTVDGHKGRLIIGEYNGKNICIVSGRFHYYEGYSMSELTYYVYVLKALNIKELIITNASGGINPNYKQGEIILIKDHINLFPENPLRGNNHELGPRFPDLLNAYTKELRTKIKRINSTLKEGVYLGWSGPSLETYAEYKFAQIIGADVVGMSTVPEVIVAKYLSIPTLVLSVVSNVVDFDSPIEATIEDIMTVMKKSSITLEQLLRKYLDFH